MVMMKERREKKEGEGGRVRGEIRGWMGKRNGDKITDSLNKGMEREKGRKM